MISIRSETTSTPKHHPTKRGTLLAKPAVAPRGGGGVRQIRVVQAIVRNADGYQARTHKTWHIQYGWFRPLEGKLGCSHHLVIPGPLA